MNTVESLYRYYKKIGPEAFKTFISEHPELSSVAKEVALMESSFYTKTVA